MVNKLSVIILSLFVSASAFGSDEFVFRGWADCGWAQDWPLDPTYTAWNQQCAVGLSLKPTQRYSNGTSVGEAMWSIDDMNFVGRYYRHGSRIEITFFNANYSGPRVVAYSPAGMRRPAAISINIPVFNNRYTTVWLTQTN